MDMNEAAKQLLGALDDSREVPGGLALRQALRQARLDGSLESLDRIDQLLAQIRTRTRPTRESWAEKPGTANFNLLLAFYLGETVARLGQTTVDWMTNAQAQERLPEQARPPEAPWSRIIGVVGGSVAVPLGVVEDGLFGTDVQVSCRAYVERLVARVAPQETDQNVLCRQFLHAGRGAGEVNGGLAFIDALKELAPDFSIGSLERVDDLLRAIRKQAAPEYADFVNRINTQNFLRWTAYYAGSTIAHSCGLTLRWLSFDELKTQFPELEPQFETAFGCVIDDKIYFPLGIATELLFGEKPQRNFRGLAGQIQQKASPPMVSIRRLHASDEAPANISAILEKGVNQAGFLAAHGMFMMEGGASLAPTVLVPGADGTATFVDFSFHGDQESILAAADERMQANPDNAIFQVLAYDGYANLPTGRTDALLLALHLYGGGTLSGRESLVLRFACPYRPASHPEGMRIYSPKLMQYPVPKEALPALLRSFYLGVLRYKSNTFSWMKLLDESI
ncbi:hypothetical protein FN976_03685 [Caenimonas sedimenti]|uniref:Uncharacterized protein n=1 Tax=Caenimonas sedimenti TaxID=2596921 RepID=A0A562ZWX1_9BURK|nr:hypothetical protein [Caenimonas sedimenti]TWO72644.1 hypothetical protein FN976_03685 [Caenimonas sedimenti]